MLIKEMVFGPKQYLALRKTVPIAQVADKGMYETAGKKLGAYIEQHGVKRVGHWAVVYFSWDQAKGETDMAISFEVEGMNTVDDPEFSVIDLPEMPAALGVHMGSYDGLGGAHGELMKYVSEKGVATNDVPALAVEEYVVDPMTDPNPANWMTNIYYLHR